MLCYAVLRHARRFAWPGAGARRGSCGGGARMLGCSDARMLGWLGWLGCSDARMARTLGCSDARTLGWLGLLGCSDARMARMARMLGCCRMARTLGCSGARARMALVGLRPVDLRVRRGRQLWACPLERALQDTCVAAPQYVCIEANCGLLGCVGHRPSAMAWHGAQDFEDASIPNAAFWRERVWTAAALHCVRDCLASASLFCRC